MPKIKQFGHCGVLCESTLNKPTFAPVIVKIPPSKAHAECKNEIIL